MVPVRQTQLYSKPLPPPMKHHIYRVLTRSVTVEEPKFSPDLQRHQLHPHEAPFNISFPQNTAPRSSPTAPPFHPQKTLHCLYGHYVEPGGTPGVEELEQQQ